jgi:hypothetical protein
MVLADYYSPAIHETASKFLDQNGFAAKYSAGNLPNVSRLPKPDPVQSPRDGAFPRGKLMKKLVFAILLIASPAWAQTKLTPKGAAARVDNCAPIGRTEDGKLVYSMKCDNLPALPPPQPQAEVAPAPPPEPEVQRSGIFGWSYERKRPGE